MRKLAWAGLALVVFIGAGWWPTDTASGQTPPGTVCPWRKDGENGTKVPFGDATGSYWQENFSEPVGASKELVVTGQFPHARYLSVYAYDHNGRLRDGLSDQQIRPDPGSSNPFQPGANRNAEPRAFTLRIKFSKRPATPEPNTLYLAKGRDRKLEGAIVYRIYFPDQGADHLGNVSAPRLFAVDGGSSAACSPDPGTLVLRPGGFRAPGSTSPISWLRFAIGAAVANPDQSYLAGTFDLGRYGPLLVIKFQRPTFPDTYRGAAISNNLNLRFLSISVATRVGETISTLPDSLLDVGPDGRTAIVVSKSADKPSSAALAREHATWLDVGRLGSDEGRLIYRNLLEHSGFDQAIVRVDENASPEEVEATMGAYYPDGRYCTRSNFEGNGCREED